MKLNLKCSAVYFCRAVLTLKYRREKYEQFDLKKNLVVSVRHSTEMASLHHQADIRISSIVKQSKQYIPENVY